VQSDNLKRKNSKDPLTGKKGSAPLASDAFVLEEIGAFDALAKGIVQSDKINPAHDIVIAYPGPALAGLKTVYQNNIRLSGAKSIRAKEQTSTTSWLNLAQKDTPSEETLYAYKPHPEMIKHTKRRKQNAVIRMAAKFAAAFVLPVVAGVLYVTHMKQPEKKSRIQENTHQRLVTLYGNGSEITVKFNKNKNDWIASEIGFGDNDLRRPLLYREDIAYIDAAQKAVLQP
jgi:hypothetical protein